MLNANHENAGVEIVEEGAMEGMIDNYKERMVDVLAQLDK